MSFQEFEGELRGSKFCAADLSDSIFREVRLDGSRITHASMVGVEIDARIDGLVVNGVDVTEFVNKNDRWFPLRTMLVPGDGAGVLAAWNLIRREWSRVLEDALALGSGGTSSRVGDGWSIEQTFRHLVFAMDKWFVFPVLGEGFSPLGMPNSGSVDFPWPGLDPESAPGFAEIFATRSDRNESFVTFVEAVDVPELSREVEVLENGTHTVLQCLQVVLEEEFWHLRYVDRDLTVLLNS